MPADDDPVDISFDPPTIVNEPPDIPEPASNTIEPPIVPASRTSPPTTSIVPRDPRACSDTPPDDTLLEPPIPTPPAVDPVDSDIEPVDSS